MRRPFLALLALVGALLTGCSDPAEPPSSGRPSSSGQPRTHVPAARSNAVPSAGCGRQATTGRHTYGGRSYLLTLPKSDGRTPMPVVVDLHGLRSTGFEQAVYSRMATTGSARGFTVVEPEGGGGRTGWKLPGMAEGSADIAYIGSLLDHLERTLCVDKRRVFATGFSNGAGLSAALVCGLNGRLAGVAPVAGLNLARPCPRARPTTIVAFHGTADQIIPYRGGSPFGGDRTRIPAWMDPVDGVFALPPVTALTDQWARTFGCTGTARDAPANEIKRVSHTGCQNGVRVDLYTITGGGHTWPGALPIGIGRTTDQIDATKVILDTFSAL
ncbi:alpha/beta hydrolase family esterase [Actinomadura rudentiformis]|uniref:Polyhydroxybutyrate depolymerase n=1 Tax=Actinomadura rudentiformis TaxID=359158 RepID=A0A6H9Z7L9_9ACTN|nr:PHB depolymerase family esterase [Actinomadura rudentiformis]KAB2350998.1 hypothetical protein F8566_08615 [Actinomadura rudentiformis]